MQSWTFLVCCLPAGPVLFPLLWNCFSSAYLQSQALPKMLAPQQHCSIFWHA